MSGKPLTLQEVGRRIKTSRGVHRGYEFQDWITAELYLRGFRVEQAKDHRQKIYTKSRGWIWITKSADFWGAVDHVAFRADEDETYFIQATISAGDVAEKRRKLEAVFQRPSNVRIVEVWLHAGPRMDDVRIWRWEASASGPAWIERNMVEWAR